jgi:hypothetical protein
MMNFLTFTASLQRPFQRPFRRFWATLTSSRPGHISAPNVSTAMAFILLAFLPLNLGLPISHSFGG